MNRLAFQTYGTKKLSLFQSVWDTTKNSVVSSTELANTAATTPLPLGWSGTNLFIGGYTHTAGNTASLLVNNLTPIAGQSYQIICTLSAGSTGSVVINWGGMSSVAISATTTITLTPINITSKLSITPSNDFVGTVSLSVRQSSSAANQIQLPISIASGKSIWVDWGDGQYSTMNSANVTANRIHTYAASGEYPVRVFGDDFSFGFANPSNITNDRLKIKTISSWGKLKIGTQSFAGCSNVTMSGITDIPDLTGIINLTNVFQSCSSITTVGRMNEWNLSAIARIDGIFLDATNFNQNIGNWNVSSVTNMSSVFANCKLFNQNLGSWNTSTCINFGNMFQGASAFNNGFASGIVNQLPWNTSNVTSMSNMFQNASAFNSNLGTGTTPWDVSKVTTFASMFQGASKFNNGDDSAPINNWDTTNITTMAAMFAFARVFNRNIGSWNVRKVTDFASMFQQAHAFNNGNVDNIKNWVINTSADVNMAGMFWQNSANYMQFNQPIGSWDVSRVIDMNNMFNANSNGGQMFNQNLNNWNVSNVRNMSSMFAGTTYFNNGAAPGAENELTWNTSACTNMSGMFSINPSFNCKLGTGTIPWNVSKVNNFSNMFGSYGGSVYKNGDNTAPINDWNIGGDSSVITINMTGMFYYDTVFNRDVSSWNVSKVTNMSYMFYNARAFNQPIGNWERVLSPNTSTLANVTNMTAMFSFATAFNKNIGNWNVSNVSAFATGDVSGMFYNATNFNNEGSGDIGNWQLKTTGTISMQNMFRNTAFNQNINAWNTVAVNNMKCMFYDARVFNQPLNAWNVNKVTDMSGMFFNTPAFNQPLNNWTTSAVISMNNMFDSDSGLICGFNQDIGSWNVSNVTTFVRFMFTKTPATFSSTNLDAIYNGWIVNGVKPNTTSPLSTNISFGTAKYTSAGTPGKNVLLAPPNNWIIQDGGI